MRTIATHTMGFQGKSYEIKLVSNSKDKSNGIIIIKDYKGSEHESGVWERIPNDKGYLYCGWTFKCLTKPNKKRKYYTRKEFMEIHLIDFLWEEEDEN